MKWTAAASTGRSHDDAEGRDHRYRRRLRGGKPAVDTYESDFDAPYGDPEADFDPEANAALRDELRTKISDLETAAEAPVATPGEADLIVDGVVGPDPATEAARARLRQKAAEAKQKFS